MIEFKSFPKIPRLFRDCVITEKLDGTNGIVHIQPQPAAYDHADVVEWVSHNEDWYAIRAGSRSLWCDQSYSLGTPAS